MRASIGFGRFDGAGNHARDFRFISRITAMLLYTLCTWVSTTVTYYTHRKIQKYTLTSGGSTLVPPRPPRPPSPVPPPTRRHTPAGLCPSSPRAVVPARPLVASPHLLLGGSRCRGRAERVRRLAEEARSQGLTGSRRVTHGLGLSPPQQFLRSLVASVCVIVCVCGRTLGRCAKRDSAGVQCADPRSFRAAALSLSPALRP